MDIIINNGVMYIVVDESKTIRESICLILISFGIKGIPAASNKEVISVISQNPQIIGAIIDIDDKELGGTELIKILKKDEKTRSLKIIAHTVQTNKKFVLSMIELGVAGYLLKPFNEANAPMKIKKILDRLETHNVERKHIRVKPEQNELLRVHFRIQGYPTLISGKVIDISMGGVAVTLFNPPEEEILKAGTRITQINFTLDSNPLSPSGEIVLLKGKTLALRFLPLNNFDETNLAKYIFRHISD